MILLIEAKKIKWSKPVKQSIFLQFKKIKIVLLNIPNLPETFELNRS